MEDGSITFAKMEWIPQLKQIWKECFHDEDSYIDFYFMNRFTEENMLVWLEDKLPVAMASPFTLHLLEKEEWIAFKTTCSLYLCGSNQTRIRRARN